MAMEYHVSRLLRISTGLPLALPTLISRVEVRSQGFRPLAISIGLTQDPLEPLSVRSQIASKFKGRKCKASAEENQKRILLLFVHDLYTVVGTSARTLSSDVHASMIEKGGEELTGVPYTPFRSKQTKTKTNMTRYEPRGPNQSKQTGYNRGGRPSTDKLDHGQRPREMRSR